MVTFKAYRCSDLIDYYDVKIGNAKYATLSLPWNATIPEGVTAYTSDCYYANNHQIDLQEVKDILPECTGVILYSEKSDTYRFYYTESIADKISENILKGTEIRRLELDDRENGFTYYVLANKSKGVGMYKLGEKDKDGNSIGIPQYRAYLKLPDYGQNYPVAPVELIKFAFSKPEDIVSEDGGFIDAIKPNGEATNAIIEIYSPNGTRLDKMQKGVNIVRMSNGVTKKVIK